MTTDCFEKLLTFVQRLEEAKIHHRLSYHIEDAISVEVYVPGEHWEVDFFADGEVYVERFRSNGQIDDESAFAELFEKHSADTVPATVGVPNEEVNV